MAKAKERGPSRRELPTRDIEPAAGAIDAQEGPIGTIGQLNIPQRRTRNEIATSENAPLAATPTQLFVFVFCGMRSDVNQPPGITVEFPLHSMASVITIVGHAPHIQPRGTPTRYAVMGPNEAVQVWGSATLQLNPPEAGITRAVDAFGEHIEASPPVIWGSNIAHRESQRVARDVLAAVLGEQTATETRRRRGAKLLNITTDATRRGDSTMIRCRRQNPGHVSTDAVRGHGTRLGGQMRQSGQADEAIEKLQPAKPCRTPHVRRRPETYTGSVLATDIRHHHERDVAWGIAIHNIYYATLSRRWVIVAPRLECGAPGCR